MRRLLAVGDLRIVNYNVLGFDGTPSPNVGAVLQAVGNEVYGGRSRPVDVVAIQEVQMQSTTTAAVVSQLNAIYGAGRYDYGRLNGTSLSTNETVGLIYNTQTVSLVDSIGVGTVSSSGAARQPIRYRLRPLELPLGNDFYVYNSHYKASDTASDRSRRNVEATSIRANADALGQGALIIYAGDFNLKTSSEAAYQTLLATGNGQALDPINRPGNWNGDPAFRDIFTQAPLFTAPSGFVGGGINDRFDFQLLSNEWTDNAGLEYVANSYHTFGNNGSVPVNGSINDPANTALPGMANRTAILNLLTTVTDHLPLVADYRFVSNLAPTDLSTSGSSVAENAAANTTVGTLSSVDPNATDTHTYSLVSGTGSTNNASFAIVGNTLRTSSTFALDGTANYSVRIRSTDNGGLFFEKSLTITVTNVAPLVSVNNATVSGNEGTTVTNSGAFSDIVLDTVTLTASVGSITKNANGTWSWSLLVADNSAASTVTITAQDEDGGSRSTSFTYTVFNVSPLVTRVSPVLTGNVLTLLTNSGTFSDVPADIVSLSSSIGTVIKNADGTWAWSYTATSGTSNQSVTVTASDEDGGSTSVSFLINANVQVSGRGIYYAGATGSSAMASLGTDKTALLPGQSSTYSHYTNYSRGLNGVTVDIAGLPSTTTATQFLGSVLFSRWNGIDAAGFTSLPATAIASATIEVGQGIGGSTRVRIRFPDNSIENTWLRVIVQSGAVTGLAADDVFYFGNVIGELNTGNTATRLRVNSQDTSLVRNNQSTGTDSASVTNIYDINRDGRVNSQDTSIVRNSQQTSGIVAPITVPPLSPPASPPAPSNTRGGSSNGGRLQSGSTPIEIRAVGAITSPAFGLVGGSGETLSAIAEPENQKQLASPEPFAERISSLPSKVPVLIGLPEARKTEGQKGNSLRPSDFDGYFAGLSDREGWNSLEKLGAGTLS